MKGFTSSPPTTVNSPKAAIALAATEALLSLALGSNTSIIGLTYGLVIFLEELINSDNNIALSSFFLDAVEYSNLVNN